MDLVDLNILHITTRGILLCRDPYGSRGSKSDTIDKRQGSIVSRSLWISWI